MLQYEYKRAGEEGCTSACMFAYIHRVVLCYTCRSDDVEMTLSHSFKHGQLVSLTDLIHNSPTANMECAQLHYLTVAIVDIVFTFNLFPLRVFTMLGSQAKDCLEEDLHIDIGQLVRLLYL